MKIPSIYNSIINLDDGRSIIYNAFTDSFIAYPTSQIEDISTLKALNPTLQSQLEENGMLVDDSIDEAEEVMRLINQIDNDTSTLHLHINPTLACNFRCWYCYEDHSSNDYMQPETISSINELLKRRIEETKPLNVQLSFFGGEPLLHFKDVAKPIIENTRQVCQETNLPLNIHFTSNAYLLNEEILKFLKDLNVSFQITLDGHRDSHNKVRTAKEASSYDVILGNVIRLLNTGKHVILRINYTMSIFHEIPDIVKDLKDKISHSSASHLTIDLQQVWQDIDLEQQQELRFKTEELMEEIRDSGYDCSAPIHCDFVRNSCYADNKNHILINYDGHIFLCTARDFNKNNSVGYLDNSGEIIWQNEKLIKWDNSKFSKSICRTCRIAPICGGGCRQKSMETFGSEVCIRDYSEEEKDKIILRRFERNFISKPASIAEK